MKTHQEIINECVYGWSPERTANDYRIAMATITAVYGPRGHKERREFSAVVDLDFKPTFNDNGMMLRVITKRHSRFRMLPVLFADFTRWTDWHGGRHTLDEVESFRFDNFANGAVTPYDPDSEESDTYDATGLDNEMTEIVIRARLANLVDESEADIEERCRLEYEAREAEQRECEEEYEAHMQAIADNMRKDDYDFVF